MPAYASAPAAPTDSLFDVDALVRAVESQTHWQVRDLDVDCRGRRVVVTGRCPTYYLKQLVTQAILSAEPGAQLQNEVEVD
ncbi:MAG: phospholipid-binding protein [Planctomycetes bacterium]|nr:phospholipid-binding protein [Planctomycetota bacterium]